MARHQATPIRRGRGVLVGEGWVAFRDVPGLALCAQNCA